MTTSDRPDDGLTPEVPAEHGGILARIIASSAKNPVLTIALVACLAAWGWYVAAARAARRHPRPVRRPGHHLHRVARAAAPTWSRTRSPTRSRRRCSSAPEVKYVRGQSFFGLSFVYVIFEDGTDMYWARSRVLEYLNTRAGQPARGGDAHPRARRHRRRLGLRVRAGRPQRRSTTCRSCGRCRTGTCATRSRACRASPRSPRSAASSSSTRSTSIPTKLLAYRRVDHRRGPARCAQSNQDVGGRTIEIAGHEHMIRGRGYVEESGRPRGRRR